MEREEYKSSELSVPSCENQGVAQFLDLLEKDIEQHTDNLVVPSHEMKEQLHISEHSDQSFRDYPITHFGLNRSLIPRLSDHF
ncbi:hypothetical protein [Vibrio vulnificus]|uniref:hypothetical protein n=2 Tax=Vibrio vulnificus TaxID=672 RepID=UPI00051D25F4